MKMKIHEGGKNGCRFYRGLGDIFAWCCIFSFQKEVDCALLREDVIHLKCRRARNMIIFTCAFHLVLMYRDIALSHKKMPVIFFTLK